MIKWEEASSLGVLLYDDADCKGSTKNERDSGPRMMTDKELDVPTAKQ